MDKPVTPIERLRHALALTQLQEARLLGVSRSTVLRWERGDRVPHAIYLDRLRDLLKERGVEVPTVTLPEEVPAHV